MRPTPLSHSRAYSAIRDTPFLNVTPPFVFIRGYRLVSRTSRSHSSLARLKLRMRPTLWPVMRR